MFGYRYPLLNLITADSNLNKSMSLPDTFDSILEAKSHLELLASGVCRYQGDLLKAAEQASQNDECLPADLQQRQCYIKASSRSVNLGSDAQSMLSRKQALESSLLAFGKALESLAGRTEIRQERAIMAIQVEYVQIQFFISNCRETREMVCDQFNDVFERAIDIAARYISSGPRFSDTTPKRAFAFEPGVLPTVFLIARKCRVPTVRQRAIDLMRDGCIQEAMWDGKPYATFMQQLAELEESMAQCSMPNDVDVSHRLVEAIPEHARFIDEALVGEVNTLDQPRMICARYRHESDGRIEITEHPVDFSGDKDYMHNICYGWR
jgi:hypothetical protein